MTTGFWSALPWPIMALAPMANVTDAAFRRIIAKYGKPDVLFTEFVSADGLCHPKGRAKLLVDLAYSETERPIVAQLFSGKPEAMFEAATLVRELGFDGLDINMGCPDRAVEKQGAGAALMKDPRRAREIIRAARRGATPLPVSVKTRLGYNRDELETWLPELLAEEPAAITIHARTRKDMSGVPARWERVRRAVTIRDALGVGTLILGNGDARDLAHAREKARETGADGIMLGRAIFGNPELFSNSRELANSFGGEIMERKLRILEEHVNLFETLLGAHKSFAIMKKHFKAYVEGWNGTKELRTRLMECENAEEVKATLENTRKTLTI